MTVLLNQFAREVTHFSSQYGTDGNVSYVVQNLAGPSTIYPIHGDMTAACVFRTYGPWWLEAPSGQKPFSRTAKHSYLGQDFVDLCFAEKVYPEEIQIYETYHPGAVVQIFGCDMIKDSRGRDVCNKWYLLWSGAPQHSSEPQIFCPSLNKIQCAVSLIRLVLHHQHLQYYTELDAVELIGVKLLNDNETDLDAVYAARLKELSLMSTESIDPSPVMSTPDDVISDNGAFDLLPNELIEQIFRDLDLADLCRVSATCKLFRKHCYLVELDLQPYWHVVNSDMLQGLSNQCRGLQKLSLSWCGVGGSLTSTTFSRFVLDCCAELKCLRLAACTFLTADNVKVIASTCHKLEELDLSSVRVLDSDSFHPLTGLENLTHLILYRTRISGTVVIQIIRNSPRLEHLNLGAIQTIQNYDCVAVEVAKCRHLLSVSFWRARSLTYQGVKAIAEGCRNLLEIDLGWCVELKVDNHQHIVAQLARSCLKLRKLFITAIRNITDYDLNSVAKCLPDLEQLDILGTLSVGPGSVQGVLESCPKLRFIDLSFCNHIPETSINEWRKTFPQCSIKRSYISS